MVAGLREYAVGLVMLACMFGCGSDDSNGSSGSGGSNQPGGGGSSPGGPASGGAPGSGGSGPSTGGTGSLPPDDTCGSVRLTSYEVFQQGWCEFDRSLPVLPGFVRDGMTAAIAEPFNGGSYEGEPGEACGECWEITTPTQTGIVMISDLCPNAGNPLCQGGYFHLDLAREAAEVLEGGGLDEGYARRVPCPVEGSIHVLVNDENFAYLRLAFLNHRVPVRLVEFRSAGGPTPGAWRALNRSGGAWEATGDAPLAGEGTGVQFRLTSAQGQVVESTVVVPTHPERRSTFDLGVQFEDQQPPTGGACMFQTSAGVVYDDAWGGIEGLQWTMNPWGAAEQGFFGEVSEGCLGDTGQCLRVDDFGQYSGLHLYYRQAFPTASFSRVRLSLRTASGEGRISVSPSNEGTRCEPTVVNVTPTYAETVIELGGVCAGVDMLTGLTLDNPGEGVTLLLDEIRFEN